MSKDPESVPNSGKRGTPDTDSDEHESKVPSARRCHPREDQRHVARVPTGLKWPQVRGSVNPSQDANRKVPFQVSGEVWRDGWTSSSPVTRKPGAAWFKWLIRSPAGGNSTVPDTAPRTAGIPAYCGAVFV